MATYFRVQIARGAGDTLHMSPSGWTPEEDRALKFPTKRAAECGLNKRARRGIVDSAPLAEIVKDHRK